MGVRHSNRLASLIAITVGLGGSSIACSKEESPASPATIGQSQIFRFAPPDGTEYVRTDRETREMAIVGVPLRRVDDEERRWRIGVERKGDEYRVKQDLEYISLARDGETVMKGKVPDGVSAELVTDDNGNLKDVEGLDKAAETLRSLVAPGKEEAAKQIISRDVLRHVVSARYRMLVGETIGRQATPGTKWTITNPPGSIIASRTVTVQGQETCDATTCARLLVDFEMDPREVSDAATTLVKARVMAAGGDASKVTVRSATYHMSGSMLIEPATMLSHGASLTEGGRVTMADSEQKELTVEIRGKTEISYSYAGAPAAAGPVSGTKPRIAAVPSVDP